MALRLGPASFLRLSMEKDLLKIEDADNMIFQIGYKILQYDISLEDQNSKNPKILCLLQRIWGCQCWKVFETRNLVSEVKRWV